MSKRTKRKEPESNAAEDRMTQIVRQAIFNNSAEGQKKLRIQFNKEAKQIVDNWDSIETEREELKKLLIASESYHDQASAAYRSLNFKHKKQLKEWYELKSDPAKPVLKMALVKWPPNNLKEKQGYVCFTKDGYANPWVRIDKDGNAFTADRDGWSSTASYNIFEVPPKCWHCDYDD